MNDSVEHADLLDRQRADVATGLFGGVRRLRWPSDRLRIERQRRLLALLAHARQHSEFHRERLRSVRLDEVDEADLTGLPVMTKQDLMSNFDAAVTDPQLTLALADDYVQRLMGNDNRGSAGDLLLGSYRAIATGGTTGLRGIFVYGWADWVNFAVLESRWRVRLANETPVPPASRIGSLFAKKAAHVSGALHAFTELADGPICHVPATMPLVDIVQTLNRAQPLWLQGYPTAILLLCGEASGGRLHIAPTHIKTCGELLTEETRLAAREAWGVEIDDSWGTSEGVYAFSCGQSREMHLPDDMVIVEPVDLAGRPVAPGQRADKIYVTNLYNFTQPLIRYELNDSMTLFDEPCPCGCAHRRIGNLEGRLDDVLVYPGGIVVHSVGLCAAMLRARRVAEYQIVQTPRGVAALVRTEGTEDLGALQVGIAQTLVDAGLSDPEVEITEVPGLDRLWSGKLRRFVPLPPPALP